MSDFPYKEITPEERDSAFEKLKEHDGELSLSSAGNKASDYYFQKYRMRTKVGGNKSTIDYWNENKDKIKRFNNHLRVNWKHSTLFSTMNLGGHIAGQFRPLVASYIYKRFKATKILDFSAGWGDRCIAAIALDIPYVGIDSNKKLKKPYHKMIDHFGGDVKMIFGRSEEVKYPKDYDLVFTSPPYFNKEKYEGMLIQDDEDFKNKYWIPTITKTYNNLKRGGHIVLNMPREMYDMTKPLLGKAKKIKMPLQNRFSQKDRFEYIYYWKKD